MSCLPSMSEIRGLVHAAAEQTDRVEQRAVQLGHERGLYAGLTCDQQRELDDLIRWELQPTQFELDCGGFGD